MKFKMIWIDNNTNKIQLMLNGKVVESPYYEGKQDIKELHKKYGEYYVASVVTGGIHLNIILAETLEEVQDVEEMGM